MATMGDREGDLFADAASFRALDFLERSRDVASEAVVHATGRETSTAAREVAAGIAPRSIEAPAAT
jgi:hypothetical protein